VADAKAATEHIATQLATPRGTGEDISLLAAPAAGQQPFAPVVVQ